MKSVLQLFELSSGLKFNFSKCNLYGDIIPTKDALIRRSISLLNGGGISSALPLTPFNHYLSHLGMAKDKKGQNVWRIIWLAIIWAIWLHRNDIIFNHVRLSSLHLLDSARVNAWLWIKVSVKSCEAHDWTGMSALVCSLIFEGADECHLFSTGSVSKIL
ncbi:hypothetical protein Lal_00003902 [Lupinus albus]|nr:hypothetical protein Lal_00003902 [Lupinus albus]